MLWKNIQRSFVGGRLDKELMGRQDLSAYFKGASELRNFYVRRQGGISKRRGTDIAVDLSNLGDMSGCRLIPIVYDNERGYYILLHHDAGERSWYASVLSSTKGIKNRDGSWDHLFITSLSYRQDTTIPISVDGVDVDLNDIDYMQSGDTVFIVHHLFPPKKFVFNPSTEKFTSIGNVDFNVAYNNIGNITLTQTPVWSGSGTRTVKYAVSLINENGKESSIGPEVSKTYKLPWPSSGTITVDISTASPLAAGSKIKVYKNESSGFGLIGTIPVDSSGSSFTFVDDYITPDLTQTPMKLEDHFNVAGEYPSVIALYQQRMVLGGTDNNPFTFYMSMTGDLYNFNTHSSIREDDALEVTLSAVEMPDIHHAVMSRDLIMFTAGGEWEIAPVSGNTISYKTISSKLQSSIGSARWTKPILIGEEIVFVDGIGDNMHATRYNYASDGYESKDLTILSKWIFENNSIVRMCYKRSPDSNIVCVLSNGDIATLAYMKEHEVCAWSRQRLGGGKIARDIASSKSIREGTTDVMLLVSNKDGTGWEAWTVRPDCTVRDTPLVEDYVCMDGCYKTIVPTRVVYHLLSGMTAVRISDGAVFDGPCSVSGPCTIVVGYRFESKLVTVYPEPQGKDTIQMEVKNATEIEAKIINGCSFTIGAYGGIGREIELVPTATDGEILLCDANVRVPIVGKNNRDGRIEITQNYPFTFNILSLSTTYQVEMANLNGSVNDNG